MKQLFILVLSIPVFYVYGQKEEKLFYGFHIRPEMTYYQDSYGLPTVMLNSESTPKSTFNFGIGAGIHYELTKSIFVETGLDYISRKLITRAWFNRADILPGGYANIKSISLRMLEFPVNLGYRLTNEKMNLYLNTGVTGNLLLNSKYFFAHPKVYDPPRYHQKIWKFDWSGYTLNLGIGIEWKISENSILNSMITYSIINTVKKDRNLINISQGGIAGISLTHDFLSLTLGVNVSNKYLNTLLLKRKYNKIEKANRCPGEGIL